MVWDKLDHKAGGGGGVNKNPNTSIYIKFVFFLLSLVSYGIFCWPN